MLPPDPRAANLTLDSGELRVIAVLSEVGSLTAAAQALGMSQPAVSQRIKRVETRLGVPVIERSGRGIRLTSAGQILAEHGRKVVDEIDAALEKIEQIRGGRGGVLRIVGFPSASATIVPDLMRLMHSHAPGVTLEYREAEPPAALAMLSDGEVDAAIVFDYADTTEIPAGSKLHPLWREELRLVVPETECAGAPDASANLSDYASTHWIAGCEKCRGNLLTAASEHGFQPEIVQETDNIPAMVAMVAAGGSVALVPGLALTGMRGLPDGVMALPLDPPRFRTVGVVGMDTETPGPQLKLVLDLLGRIDPHKWQIARIETP